jgi:hypothetical protein
MKITPTGVWAFDEYLRQLSAGIRSLDGTDGRARARGTARKRVLKALRSIRRVMDERAPAIIERKGGERLKTFKAREARLRKHGYTHVSQDYFVDFAAVGVPVKKIVHRTKQPNGTVYEQTGLFAPKWAVAIGRDNPTKLRQAKKSVMLQKAVLAEKALRESVMP